MFTLTLIINDVPVCPSIFVLNKEQRKDVIDCWYKDFGGKGNKVEINIKLTEYCIEKKSIPYNSDEFNFKSKTTFTKFLPSPVNKENGKLVRPPAVYSNKRCE